MTESSADQEIPDLQYMLGKLQELYDESNLSENKEDLTGKATKLIDCPHEIIFKITANVLEQNEQGELVSSKEICTKNYHVPVPMSENYKEYMSTFFEFIENGLVSSANKIYEPESQEHKEHKDEKNKNKNKKQTRSKKRDR